MKWAANCTMTSGMLIDSNICQHVADQQVVSSLTFEEFCFGSV